MMFCLIEIKNSNMLNVQSSESVIIEVKSMIAYYSNDYFFCKNLFDELYSILYAYLQLQNPLHNK